MLLPILVEHWNFGLIPAEQDPSMRPHFFYISEYTASEAGMAMGGDARVAAQRDARAGLRFQSLA
jgi:hypothetical protein